MKCQRCGAPYGQLYGLGGVCLCWSCYHNLVRKALAEARAPEEP